MGLRGVGIGCIFHPHIQASIFARVRVCARVRVRVRVRVRPCMRRHARACVRVRASRAGPTYPRGRARAWTIYGSCPPNLQEAKLEKPRNNPLSKPHATRSL